MENLVLKKLIRDGLIGLASGVMLVACGGGSNSQGIIPRAALLADGESCQPAWVGSQAYSGAQFASRNGRNYTAAYWTQGNDSATSSDGAGSGQPWTTGFLCGSTPTPTPTPTPSSCLGYVAGTTYTANQVVTNVGGWCSSTASSYYAPGMGSVWTSAWHSVTAASCGSTPSPTPIPTSTNTNTKRFCRLRGHV